MGKPWTRHRENILNLKLVLSDLHNMMPKETNEQK